MKDQHYPGLPMKGTVADYNGKGNKGMNKMKAHSYNARICPLITQEPAANEDNVVDYSILLKDTSDSLKELSSHVYD